MNTNYLEFIREMYVFSLKILKLQKMKKKVELDVPIFKFIIVEARS
jgi:hypothetical protein